MVTSPAVPPYSSTTIARWVWSRCISRSRSSAGLLSGTKTAGRISWSTVTLWTARRVGVEPPGDVLEVEHAEHVVRALPDHRDAGEAGAQEQRKRLAQQLSALDDQHVGARHHDLAHHGVAELEDRVDHLPLAGLDDRVLAGQVDQVAQLGLRGERAVPEAAARA